ncbi:MAG: DUF6391 domain-containing protein [Chloroflexota bacterium]
MTFVTKRQEYNHAMILDLPLILETRRNHALEHATLHMLARAHNQPMAGHSNPTGFFLLGDLSAEEVTSAATEAWTRLNAGEHHLAIHPGCGTNLATNLVLAATLGWLPLRGRKSTLGRLAVLPLAILFAMIGFSLARPLGPKLQERVTTEARLGNMRIVEVRFMRKGVHRVITK